MENHEEHDKQAKERIINDIKEYDCHLALKNNLETTEITIQEITF